MTCADENTSAETLAAALAPLAVQDGKALTEAAARRWLLTEDPAVRSWLCGVDAARLAPLMANAGLRMSVFPHLYADGITLPEGGYPAAPYSEIPTLLLTGADEFNAAARWDSWFSSEEAKRFSADELEAAKQFAATYGSALFRVFSTRGSAEVIAALRAYLKKLHHQRRPQRQKAAFRLHQMAALDARLPRPAGAGCRRGPRHCPMRRPDRNERIAACRHGGGQHPLSRPETGRDQKRAQGQILRLSIAVFPFSANKKHRSAERCFFVY